MNGGTYRGRIAASRDSLQRPCLSLSLVPSWFTVGLHHPLICTAQKRHAAINRSSSYGCLCFVIVLIMALWFVMISFCSLK